jgi:hypothetical protein
MGLVGQDTLYLLVPLFAYILCYLCFYLVFLFLFFLLWTCGFFYTYDFLH